MTTYLANSKGQPLEKHLIAVSEMARCLAIELLPKKNEILEEASHLAGLFHDVGKIDDSFQDTINDSINQTTTSDKKEKPEYFHNEISLAIFDQLESGRYSFGLNLDKKSFKRVIALARHSIYWHHPERLFPELEGVKDIDISKMHGSIVDFMREVNVDIELDDLDDTCSTTFPRFVESNNAQMFFVLMVVTTADGIISKLTPEALQSLIDKKDYARHIPRYWNPIAYSHPENSEIDLQRLANQENIADQSLNHKTVQINAPTAFGKTFIMFLRALKSGKRTYIVCPRNIIADSIFEEFVDIANQFNVKLDIELYYGSERKSSTDGNTTEPFTSQIVITNIDNYIKSFNNSEEYYKNYSVVDSDLIIDEFHELISDSPMFSVTLDVLRMRHLYVNGATTMLVSATPSLMADMIHDDIVYLPAKGRHYPSINTEKYHLRVQQDEPKTLKNGEICILNSIRNVQAYAGRHKLSNIIHSNYVKKDITRIKNNFIRKFGKRSETYGKNTEKSVSSLILQSSLNISFNGMYESCISPENTMQRLGRCSRFGEYKDAQFTIFITKDLGEMAVGRTIYNDALKQRWFSFCSKYAEENPTPTLDEMYLMYNEFNSENEDRINAYLDSVYSQGINDYHQYNLQPKRRAKFEIADGVLKEGVKTFGGLRDPLAGYFVVPKIGKHQYKPHVIGETDSMNIAHHVFEDHWKKANLSKKDDKFWYGEISRLIGIGYVRWQPIIEKYLKYKKKNKTQSFFTDKLLKDSAKWSETPLPGVDYEYCEVIGLVDTTKNPLY